MNITVLLGGTSSERDVSLASGLRIAEALRTRGHAVTALDTAFGPMGPREEGALLEGGVLRRTPPDIGGLAALERRLPALLGSLPGTDVAFLALHGGRGEDGTTQALLDLLGVPYTGSGHLASALAMDKELSKQIFRQSQVPTPEWAMAPVGEDEVRERLGFPCIVKPSKQGSTVGLSLVREGGQLGEAVETAFRHDDEVIVERYIAGRELTVAILGDEALPVGEIIPVHEIYDYECKYTGGMAREVFPADLDAGATARIQGLALRAARALKLGGCSRIDFRLGADDEFYCLEANTLPGMTELSLVPQAAAAAGLSFPELCERIVSLALPPGGRS